MDTQNLAVKAAIEAVEGQTQTALARLIDTTQQNVSNYLNGVVAVPVDKALRIEVELGVPKEDIRPDYPWHKLKNSPPS